MEAQGDQPLVPAAAVLILEQHQFAGFVHARGQARRLQRHQRDQRVHARLGD